MNDSRARVLRLARLQAMADNAARSSERAFARAIAEAASTAARLSHIEGLILTTAPLAKGGNAADLCAAAQLRALLVPAAELAEARLLAAVAERAQAEARLAHSRARSRRLAEIVAEARAATTRLAEQAEIEMRPIPRSRKAQGSTPFSKAQP